MERLRIVVPVYNDWVAFGRLLRELDVVAATLPMRVAVSAVNDGSTEALDGTLGALETLRHMDNVEVVHLYANMGHQRAIAIGLCAAVEKNDADGILIMDSDGEDEPSAIPRLLAMAAGREEYCVVARRGQRTENLRFRMGYVAYKFIFKALTARQINFGSFSLLSRGNARKLVRVADLWNNLAVAILRSKLQIQPVQVDRGRRYAGESKMNFTSLVVHGFSGISVYAETIFARLLLLTIALFCMSVVLVVTVLTLRMFFPGHATPGWATTVSFGMAILLVQVLSVAVSSLLMLLNSRVQRLVLPINEYALYVERTEMLLQRQAGGALVRGPAARALAPELV